MNIRNMFRVGRYLSACLTLFLASGFGFCSEPGAAAKEKETVNYFGPLKKRLVQDGFAETKIDSIFSKTGVALELDGISAYFKHSEAKLNYDQFLSDTSIKNAKQYMSDNEDALLQAEILYRVDKEIITAIILVETRLGTFLGKSSIFNILATMASLEDAQTRNLIRELLTKSSRPSKKKFDKWSKRKSQWAYAELKAFIKYTSREKIDPADVYGSYAGALGIAQFMPSNALTLAKDGNADGQVDLFNHTDAIASIANYLKHFGWHPGIEGKKAFQVLYKYNHSKYYVKTLLNIAKRLKK